MTDPHAVLRLACKHCEWRPSDDLTIGVVEAHMATEHPEAVQADGSTDVSLDMVVVCPRCDLVCPKTSQRDGQGWTEYLHDCPSCKRTYRLRANS